MAEETTTYQDSSLVESHLGIAVAQLRRPRSIAERQLRGAHDDAGEDVDGSSPSN